MARQGEDAVMLIAPNKTVEFSTTINTGCPDGCPPQVQSAWTLTFVPRTVESRLPDPRQVDVPRGAAGYTGVTEYRVVSDRADFKPTRPGRVIVQYTAKVTCGGATCPNVVGARTEFEVRPDNLDEQGCSALLAKVESLLPEIPGGRALQDQERELRAAWRASGQVERADRAVSPTAGDYRRAVGAWFAQTTGWKPGVRYMQSFDLPGGCTFVRSIRVVSSSAWNIVGWTFDDPGLEPGVSAVSSVPVFGESVPARARAVSRVGGGASLELDMPLVDASNVAIDYVDAQGRRQSLRSVCPGTIDAAGKPVDGSSAPSAGGVRVRVCNVAPSRVAGDELPALQRAIRLLAQRFGCSFINGSAETLRDAQGRQSVFAEGGLSGGNIPAWMIARYLQPIADRLEARVVVEGGLITLVGPDLPGAKPLLPARFGGAGRR